MAGTPEGARKAVETKKKKYGENALKEWGQKGGKKRNRSPKRYSPFEGNEEFARTMGKIGGAKRWKKPLTEILKIGFDKKD